MDQLAGADDRVDHRRAPAGRGMTDEQPVPHAELGRPDTPLDRIVVDADAAIGRLRIAGEFRPLVDRVTARLAQQALRQLGALQRVGMYDPIGHFV